MSGKRKLSFLSALVGLIVTGGAALFLLASPALATNDKDCKDFQYQEDAQAYLQAHPADKDKLDEDKDGIACEKLPKKPSESPKPNTPASPPSDNTPDNGSTLPVTPGFDHEKQIFGFGLGLITLGGGLALAGRRRETA